MEHSSAVENAMEIDSEMFKISELQASHGEFQTLIGHTSQKQTSNFSSSANLSNTTTNTTASSGLTEIGGIQYADQTSSMELETKMETTAHEAVKTGMDVNSILQRERMYILEMNKLKEGSKSEMPNSFSRITAKESSLPRHGEFTKRTYAHCVLHGFRETDIKMGKTEEHLQEIQLIKPRGKWKLVKSSADIKEQMQLVVLEIEPQPSCWKTIRVKGAPYDTKDGPVDSFLILTFLDQIEYNLLCNGFSLIGIARGASEDNEDLEARRFLMEKWSNNLISHRTITIGGKLMQVSGPDQKKIYRANIVIFVICKSISNNTLTQIQRRMGMHGAGVPTTTLILQGFAFELYTTAGIFLYYRYASWFTLTGNPIMVISNLQEGKKEEIVIEILNKLPQALFIHERLSLYGLTLVIVLPLGTHEHPDLNCYSLEGGPTIQDFTQSPTVSTLRILRNFFTLHDRVESPWVKGNKELKDIGPGLREAMDRRKSLAPVLAGEWQKVPSKRPTPDHNMSSEIIKDEGASINTGKMQHPSDATTGELTVSDHRNHGEAVDSTLTVSTSKLESSVIAQHLEAQQQQIMMLAQAFKQNMEDQQTQNRYLQLQNQELTSAVLSLQKMFTAMANKDPFNGDISSITVCQSAETVNSSKAGVHYEVAAGLETLAQEVNTDIEAPLETLSQEVNTDIETPKRKRPSDDDTGREDTTNEVTNTTHPSTFPIVMSTSNWVSDEELLAMELPTSDDKGRIDKVHQVNTVEVEKIQDSILASCDTIESDDEEDDYCEVITEQDAMPSNTLHTLAPSILPTAWPYCNRLSPKDIITYSSRPMVLSQEEEEPFREHLNPCKLRVRLSKDKALDSSLARYSISIGKEAYATVLIPKDTHIPLEGRVISKEEKALLVREGKGTYIYANSQETLIWDAAEARLNGDVGSAINSALHVWSFSKGGPAISNCRFKYNKASKIFYYITTKIIFPGEALYTSYGASHRMSYQNGDKYIQIPSRILSPFVGLDARVCLNRISRVWVDCMEGYRLKIDGLIPGSHGLEALVICIHRQDAAGVIQVLKDAGKFTLQYFKTTSPPDCVEVVSNGLCFWDSLYYAHCQWQKSKFSPNWAKRRIELVKYINLWGIQKLKESKSTFHSPEEIELAIDKSQHALVALEGNETLGRQYWGADTEFPLYDPKKKKNLWKINQGEEVYHLVSTPIASAASSVHTYEGLRAATGNSVTNILLANSHFSPMKRVLAQDTITQLIVTIAGALMTQVNV